MISTTAAFAKTLASLNEEQRSAVEGIHGPWMVLAGPGTGKTHMLAARIGNILLTEQIEPRNILCLTFTNAGVKAMRERLVSFLGAPGSRVAVHTFHDFARDVIEEFPQLFEYIEWESTDELDRRRLVNEVIDGLAPTHPMRGPIHEPYRHASDLLWLFDKMAQESWSAEQVVAAANHHVLDLPNIKEYVYQRRSGDKVAGDLKPTAAAQAERMERLKAAAGLAGAYAELKRKRALYDYADQLSWLYQGLERHPELRLQLQERYQFILVDEYQDTNGIQNEILALLAEDENPNLFVVGDDDQSIYGFQGARVEGLRQLVDRYRADINLVVLRANYRSHQAILSAAERVIGHNKTRLTAIETLALEKHLIEASGFAERPQPRVIDYPTPLAQAHHTAVQIQAWLAAGVAADEIAVIYRKHAQSARLIEALERLSVPYRLQRSINVLQHSFVRRLRMALGFLAGLRSDRPTEPKDAFEFLMAPAIGLELTEVLVLDNYRFGQRYGVPSWHHLMLHAHDVSLETPLGTVVERLRRAGQLLNELGELIDRYPLGTLVQQVAQRTGLLREAITGDERELALECMDALVRDAYARVRKTPTLTLGGLCALWEEMDGYDLALPLVKQADTRPAVSLMTAHSAKGLEFDCVVLYDVTTNAWESGRKRATGFALPPELSFELEKSAQEEENRRLLYVALTRARRELLITLPAETETGGGNSLASAIEDLLSEELATREEGEVDGPGLYDALADLHQRPLPTRVAPLDATVAQEAIAEAPLTLGALTEFERCKVSYHYQYVRRVPKATSAVGRYRETVHDAIRSYYAAGVASEAQAFAPVEELVAGFHYALGRQRGGMSTLEHARYLEEGEAVLRTWFDAPADPRRLDALLERSLDLETPAGLKLRGRIDRVDLDRVSQTRVPVDYKFGEPKEINFGKSREGRPKCLDDRLWRQLAFYAILLREGINQGRLPPYGKIVWLSAKGVEVTEVPLDADTVARFEEELDATYQRMLACDDFEGCLHDEDTSDFAKEKCPWCAFHYLNRNSVELVSEAVDALDE